MTVSIKMVKRHLDMFDEIPDKLGQILTDNDRENGLGQCKLLLDTIPKEVLSRIDFSKEMTLQITGIPVSVDADEGVLVLRVTSLK